MVSNDQEKEDLDTETDLKLRDRYLLERDRIKSQIGDLPQILGVLGLNQRRACQLLLVDPSAWTRWNKSEAPPHIYQALKWLVMLKKTNPNLVGSTDIENRIDIVQSSTQNKLKELERNVASLERALTYQPVATSSTNDSIQLTELFRAQEERLQKRISELEMEVKKLLVKPKSSRATSNFRKSKLKKPIRKKIMPKIKTKRNSVRIKKLLKASRPKLKSRINTKNRINKRRSKAKNRK